MNKDSESTKNQEKNAKEPQKGIDCDACARKDLSPDEVFRGYGATFCEECFKDCVWVEQEL